jgi:hypothetical protein
MGLGNDIKDAINEVGSAFILKRDSVTISGEFAILKPNRQVTKPFIREFFLESDLSYDTQAKVGDIFEVSGEGLNFLIMNSTPEFFESEIIRTAGVLYKVNVSGELLRPSGESWDVQYHKETQWEVIKSNCYALQTEPLYGGGIDENEQLGEIGIARNELYVPSRWNLKILDRYQATSGEYYKVTSVKSRRFSGVDVLEIEEDNR